MGSRELSIDEPFSVFYAQAPVKDIIKILSLGNNPPLYEILLHYWVKLFGISAWAVRLPSLLLGSLSCAMMYVIGRRYFSALIGFFAALLFLGNNFLTYHSLEARTYSLFLFLSILSSWYFLNMLSRYRPKQIVLYVITSALMLYSHYTGWILLFFQFLAFFIKYKEYKTYRRSYFIALASIALLFLPQFTFMVKNAVPTYNAVGWIPFSRWERFPEFFHFITNKILLTIIMICVVLIGSTAFLIKKRGMLTMAQTLTMLIALGGYPLFFLIGFKESIFFDRYMIFILPYVFLCFCWISFYLFSRMAIVTTGIFVCGILLFSTSFNTDDGRRYKVIMRNIRNDSPTLTMFSPAYNNHIIAYHYDKAIFKSANDRAMDSMLRIHKVVGFYMGSSFDTTLLLKSSSVYIIAPTLEKNFHRYINSYFDIADSAAYADTKVYHLLRKDSSLH